MHNDSDVLEQQARKKAGRLVGMVRAPSALESQGGFARRGIPTITTFALSLEVASGQWSASE